MAINKNRNSF